MINKPPFKEIFIGFVVGLIANTFGVIGYLLLFSPYSLETSIEVAQETGQMGSIIGLGALLNLAAFFGFLKIKRDYRARGVLLATIGAALLILILKIIGA
ncbi:MAG: hypothetical protein KIH80_004485 [Flavobacteriia bacterium]|nr:hypothetical protein [Flavobacteriia bacterium]